MAFGVATAVGCVAVVVLAAAAGMFAVTGRGPSRRLGRSAAIATGYLVVWFVLLFAAT